MAWDKDDDGLREYLARIGSHRLLTQAEEVDLARRARAGDKRAREQLIQSNMRLALSIAQGFSGRGMASSDLIQEGIVGLHIAADKFNPELGYRFSTYATWWIRKAIQRGFASSGAELIRLPTGVRQRRGKALAAQANNPGATIEQIAEQIKEDPELVRQALEAASVVISLHASAYGQQGGAEDFTELGDRLPDPHADDPHAMLNEVGPELAVAISGLGELEREVIELRFGIGCRALGLDEIAAKLGRAPTVVQAAQRRALAALRGALIQSGP